MKTDEEIHKNRFETITSPYASWYKIGVKLGIKTKEDYDKKINVFIQDVINDSRQSERQKVAKEIFKKAEDKQLYPYSDDKYFIIDRKFWEELKQKYGVEEK